MTFRGLLGRRGAAMLSLLSLALTALSAPALGAQRASESALGKARGTKADFGFVEVRPGAHMFWCASDQSRARAPLHACGLLKPLQASMHGVATAGGLNCSKDSTLKSDAFEPQEADAVPRVGGQHPAVVLSVQLPGPGSLRSSQGSLQRVRARLLCDAGRWSLARGATSQASWTSRSSSGCRAALAPPAPATATTWCTSQRVSGQRRSRGDAQPLAAVLGPAASHACPAECCTPN